MQPKKEESGKQPLKLRLDLNLEIEIELRAKIHGDLTLALLYVHHLSFVTSASNSSWAARANSHLGFYPRRGLPACGQASPSGREELHNSHGSRTELMKTT